MKRIKLVAAVCALSLVVVGSAFTSKKAVSKNYGIVSVMQNSPSLGRTTIELADLAILDAQSEEVYECVSASAHCKVLNLDIVSDLTNEQNVTAPFGSWNEKVRFDIPATGSDITTFQAKRSEQNTQFQYIN